MFSAPHLDVIILAVAIIIDSLLALLVFANNPKGATNKIFVLLGLTISVWLGVLYTSLQPLGSSDVSLFWIRMSIFLATPMSMLFFLLSHTLPSDKLRMSRKMLFVLLGVTALVMAVSLSPLAFTEVVYIKNSPTPTPGPGLALFALFALGSSLAAIATLLLRLKRSQGKAREQFRLIMLGILLMYGLLIFTVLLPVAIFKINRFVIFSPVYTLVFLGFTTYAIIRNRLLDIRLVLARTLGFLLVIGVMGVVASLSFVFIGNVLFQLHFNSYQLLFFIFLTPIVAFNFQFIQSTIEKLTDSIFYKGYYDTNSVLSSMGKVMSTTIDLNILTESILQILSKELRIAKGAFILLEGKSIYAIKQIGFEKGLNMQYLEIEEFLTQRNFVVFDDLEEGILKELMRKLDLGFTKILEVKDGQVGLLILGHKASGEIYSERDLRLLEIIIPEVAIAIQNAQSYDKIKKFNITLTQEVQRATSELRVANEKLKELDKLKDDFVSVASHELRTPMTAIKSYSWMALNRADEPLTEKMRKYLSRTLISTDRLINLVNDLLNISRIESGRIGILPQAFDVRELVEEVITEVTPKASEKSLHINLLRTRIPEVFADPDKVHQVLLNLVGNSLKFTPENGSITIATVSDGTFVEVSVKDSGVGISKEDIPRLFSKFGRLDQSYVAAATSGGTGLGLYICRSLIELMKGKIWVNSEGVGKGTTFTFSLPAVSPKVIAEAEKYTIHTSDEERPLEPAAF